jgi:N-methylhydantoinase B
VIEALSQAVPERTIAGSGILQAFAIAGVGDTYWLHNAYDFGGVGARRGRDGVDATGLHFGIGRNQIPQVEPVERKCRLRVEAVELIEDSGGAGRWRGGLGARTTFRVFDDCLVSVRTDRFRSPPAGVDGGRAARAGAFYRLTPTGERVEIGSKVANVRLDAGDRFVMETSGGGGLGDPRDRPVDEVAADVAAGRVSRRAALAEYGVVIDDDGTAARRAT